MESSERVLLYILSAVLIVILIQNWNKWFGLNTATATSSGTTNGITSSTGTGSTTSILDGTPCATPGYVGGNNGTYVGGVCVATPAEGSACVNINGVSGIWTNGACVVSTSSTHSIKVTNTNGARLYKYYSAYAGIGAQFVPQNNGLRYNTVIPYTQRTETTPMFFNTSYGYVSSNDATIV